MLGMARSKELNLRGAVLRLGMQSAGLGTGRGTMQKQSGQGQSPEALVCLHNIGSL